MKITNFEDSLGTLRKGIYCGIDGQRLFLEKITLKERPEAK